MVKCLAEGHKHHGRSQDSNPHSDDSAIRTQIQCTKPLGHGGNVTSLETEICTRSVGKLWEVWVISGDT